MLYIYSTSAPHLSRIFQQVSSGNPGQSALRFSHPGSPDTPARGQPLDHGPLGAAFLAVKTTQPLTQGEHETMPFLRQGAEPLDKLIAVRLTATEKERLLENVDHAGLSLSRVCPAASVRAPRPGPDGRGDGAGAAPDRGLAQTHPQRDPRPLQPGHGRRTADGQSVHRNTQP